MTEIDPNLIFNRFSRLFQADSHRRQLVHLIKRAQYLHRALETCREPPLSQLAKLKIRVT
jgi:hypothetical protein